MSLERNIIPICLLHCILIRGVSNFEKIKYDVNKYFFDSNYVCHNKELFGERELNYLRRCKLVYTSPLFSPKCIFCPFPCSVCAHVLKEYRFNQLKDPYLKGDVIYKCMFHSIDRIEPRKIKSIKGATVPDTVKCAPKDFCKTSPCKNKGTCVNLFYSYICICENGFHGKDCASSAPEAKQGKLSHGVQLWFPLEVVAARFIPFFITVAHEGEDQVLEVSTANGYTVRLKPTHKIKNFPQSCNPPGCRCPKGCSTAYSGNLITDNFYLKKNFFYLPILMSNMVAFSFVTIITLRVYNLKSNKLVLEEKIQSATNLRYRKVFTSEIFPTCTCQAIASKITDKAKVDEGLNGDCQLYPKKVTLSSKTTPKLISFNLRYIRMNYNILKTTGASMPENGYIRSDTKECETFYYKKYWRFYDVDDLYKLNDDTENREVPGQVLQCEKGKPDNTCQIQMKPEIKSGEYVLRLTLQSYSHGKGNQAGKILNNIFFNYYCYFKIQEIIRKLIIKDKDPIKRCDVTIETDGFDTNGELTWTCTAKKGTCPTSIATTSKKATVLKAKFKDGEYTICVEWKWTDGTTILSKPCISVIAENCESKPQKPDYAIQCLQNCDSTQRDPEVPVRLDVVDRVTQKVADNVTYTIKDDKGNKIPIDSVSITEGSRKNIIRIDISKLEPGVKYEVTAKVGEYTTPPETIWYKVHELPKDGNCTVKPMEGVKGVTLFDIECFGWQTEGPILYEFFDKAPEDIDHYQGRMIAYSYSGILSKFRLTRGNVVIYLVNEDGDGPSVNLSVKLTEFNGSVTHIAALMQEIDLYMEYKNYAAAMDVISTAAEILYKDMDNDYYIRKMISTMYKVRYETAEDMKLGLSTMLSVLVNGTLKGTYLLDDVEELHTGRILVDIASVYLKFAVEPGHIPRLRAKHINELSRNMMDCVDMTMIAQNKNVTKLEPQQDVNFDVMDNLNFASNDIAEALMIAMYLVGRSHVFGEAGAKISSKEKVTDMWAWVDNAKDLVNVAGNNISSFVNITDTVADKIDPNHDIMLQFSLMNKNLFWWAKGNINTEVLMVGLGLKLYNQGYYYMPRAPAPVQIFLKIKKLDKTTVTGNVTQLDPGLGNDTLNKIILVHRFVLPPLSRLFITFKFSNQTISKRNVRAAETTTVNVTTTPATTESTAAPESTTESVTSVPPPQNLAPSLRVLVTFNIRPDWESMMEQSTVLSSENPQAVVPYDIIEREHFYYMAILPDSSVSVNQTVDYMFDIHYVNCHVWQNQWINHYCLVGTETSEDIVECQCTHLSIFSSTIFIPPNDINPVLDAPLFLTVLENPYVVIFVLLILLLFLLLLIWAYRKDKKDARCGEVIVLHDNYPGESYAYLIAVFTGARLTAGTSAVVGLRLYGDVYASRPTVLKCESGSRKVLQRDQDDWFLLTYPVSVGMLNAVQLWHNNRGRGPDWFCSKIIIYDLEAKTQYLFIVDQWLAMEADEFPEAMVRPATSDEVLGIKRIFLDNSVLNLRENHLHLSIFTRHPRSPVGRKQRLIVLMVLIMTSMLSSIMFFKVSDKFAETVDEYRYSFGQREMMISIQAFIISTIISFTAMFLFRKGYKQKDFKRHRSTLFMPRKRSEDTDKYWMSQKPIYVDLSTFIAYDEKPVKRRKDMSMYEAFIAALRNCVHSRALRPVHLATESSEIKVNKGWLTAAWIFGVAVIVICSYLVMLYSLKFGKIKSLKWFSSLLASQLEDIFLFTPLKLIIIAALMSAAFERTTDISSFALNVDKAVKKEKIGDKKYLDQLVALRKTSVYYPMTDPEKVKRRRRTMRKMKWRIICDFFSVLTYIFILCYIMRILWSASRYYPNLHAKDIMLTKYHGRFIALEEVFNRTQFFSYLQNTFVRSIYIFRWFDNLNFKLLSSAELTSSIEWTKDFVSKMLGAPRLRQLRVAPSVCTVSQMMMVAIKECNHAWSPSYMDKDTYGVQWKKAEFEDELSYSWGYQTYWMYTEPKNSSVFPISGKTGTTYPTGGYILPLSVKREKTKSFMTQVEQEHWIDERTRAVFLELTLYNPNSHLYSQVTAIVEHMASGLFLTTANVDSVRTQEDWSVWNAIYIVFIVALIIRICYNVNRHGLFKFFREFFHVYEVLVVVISILSIVYYLIHIKVSTIYVEKFHREGMDRFFNFKDMIKYFKYTKVLMWVLFCLLIFRLFVSWYFGPAYVTFYYTFLFSKRWIFVMMVSLLFYFFIIWRVFGYAIDAKLFYNYRVNILHYKMYTTIFIDHTFPLRAKAVAFALCILALFFKIVFFTFFSHYYQIGKRKKLKTMQYFSFPSFVLDEIKRGFGKKKKEDPRQRRVTDREIHLQRDLKIPRTYRRTM